MSSQPAQPGMDTFTLFPALPAELRAKIWTHALPTGRVVLLQKTNSRPTRLVTDPSAALQFRSLMGTNKESREETLKHYVTIKYPRDATGYVRPVYLRLDIDALVVSFRATPWFLAVATQNAAIFEQVRTLSFVPSDVNHMSIQFKRLLIKIPNAQGGGVVTNTVQHNGREFALWYFPNLHTLRLIADYPDVYFGRARVMRTAIQRLEDCAKEWYEKVSTVNDDITTPVIAVGVRNRTATATSFLLTV